MLSHDDDRQLKADMKLYGQTFMAHSFCRVFMNQDDAATIGNLLSTIQSGWKPGARLAVEQERQLRQANEALRKVYETAPGRESSRTCFEEQFATAVGCREYSSKIFG